MKIETRWQIENYMMDHIWLEFVVTVIIIMGIAFGIAFGINAISANADRAKYNDGVCKACGGHYVYEQAVGHRYSTAYIYRCDRCDARIEIDHLPETK